MSSFMCSPVTIYVISDHLFTLRKLTELKELGLIKKDPLSVERVDLFNLLYQMNKKALIERYGEGVEDLIGYEMLDGFYRARREYGEKEELIPDLVLYYKINCFLYQCAEGKVADSPLYKYIDNDQAYLARDIVMQLPEYQNISIDEWN